MTSLKCYHYNKEKKEEDLDIIVAMLTVSLKNEVNRHKVGQDNRRSKKRTCVADIEAFSGIRVIRLKFQPHDVTIRGDL